MSKHSVLIPEYMKSFQCIGPKCEDLCCHGFRVDIDKPTYLKYIHTKDKELKKHFKTVLQLYDDKQTDLEYAYLKYPENNRCPMLTDVGWCSIQQKMGEEALSLTCHSYPRVTNDIFQQIEKGGTTSCPEIARIALLNKDGISFEQFEEEDSVRNAIGYTMNQNAKISPYFWDLRVFSIELLQNRSYAVVERMIILGLFCQKATQLLQADQYEMLPNLMEQYKELYLHTNQFRDLEKKMVHNPIWQLNVFRKLFKATEKISTQSLRYEKILQDAFTGFHLQMNDESDFTNEDNDAELKHYLNILAKWHPVIEKEYEYMFENYLVNSVFINVFPTSGYSTMLEEFMMLTAKYTMIRFLVYGVAEHTKESFNENDIVTCVQVYSKKIEHSQTFVKYIYEQFIENQCNNMAKLSILLKTI